MLNPDWIIRTLVIRLMSDLYVIWLKGANGPSKE